MKLGVVRKITRKKNQKGVEQLMVNLPSELSEPWADVTQVHFKFNPNQPDRLIVEPVR